jgi:proteasome lid subunit RPN8/RPN11
MAMKIDDYANEPVIRIKPVAYLTMLKHVLLYGNDNLEESVEVMGICYGKEEDGEIVLYEAVPVSHGGAIEVDFSPEDYAAFAVADEKMAEKGYYAIGWYHSHPGLKAFFSKVDVKNHLFYQKESTPNAFGIVFDHTYFNSDDEKLKFGFQVFRLNDITKGMDSDYHDANYEVELADDLSYYSELDNIIEKLQKKEPIISEARESMGAIAEWDYEDEDTTEDAIKPTKKKDEFGTVKQSLTEGAAAFSSMFTNPFMDQFHEFTSDTQSAALKGPIVMIDALKEMRDTIASGLGRVKSYFEKTLEKEISDVSDSVEKVIKTYSMAQMQIPKKIQSFVDKMSGSLTEVVESQLDKSLEGLISNMKKVGMVSQKMARAQESFKDSVDQQEESLKAFPAKVKENSETLAKSIGGLPNEINGLITARGNKLKASIGDLKIVTDEMKAQLDALTKVVMAKRK